MMHSPIMKWVGCFSWLVTALASINMLTGMYDYNFILYIGGMMPALVMPIVWLIGICGFLSLAMWVKMTFMHCDYGSCDACKCNQ